MDSGFFPSIAWLRSDYLDRGVGGPELFQPTIESFPILGGPDLDQGFLGIVQKVDQSESR